MALFLALLPLSNDASAQLRFSYECYRVTNNQNLPGAYTVCYITGVSSASRARVFFMTDASERGESSRVGASEISSRVEDDEQTSCDATERPVVIAGGNKILPQLDFASGTDTGFGLGRAYDSSSALVGAFGANWASSIDYGLVFEHGATQCIATLHTTTFCSTTPTGLNKVFVRRPGGGRVSLTLQTDGAWKDSGGRFELSSVGGNWVLWSLDGGTENYNGGGQPISTRDEVGAGLNFTYDGTGKLTQVAHTSGRSMALTWTNQKISNVLGPDGKNYTFSYTTQGFLQNATAPDGLGQKTYHYEAIGKPWLLTGFSVDGVRKTRYAYQADGRVLSSGDEDGGHKSTFTYGANLTSVTNALGQTKTYQITDEGRISQINRPASAACPSGARTSQYDTMGRVTLEIDGSGNRTRYAYTTEGRLALKSVGETSTGDTSKQQVTVYVWNAAQTRIDAIREYGATVTAGDFIRETILSYYADGDSGGRARLPLTVTVHDRTSTAAPSRTVSYDYTFHANKEISQYWIDGPLPGTVDRAAYEFSSVGNLTKVTNPLGHVQTYTNYTALGQPGRITDANGLITDFVHDAKGRVIQTTVQAPGGNRVTTFTHDGSDNLATTTDSTGQLTEFLYNHAGEMTQMKAPAAHPLGDNPKAVRNLAYNKLGQLTGVSTLQGYLEWTVTGYRPNGEPIEGWVSKSQTYSRQQWAYDAGGFRSNALGNNGQDVKYAYNANGDLASVTDSLNQATTTLYDSHGRIKSVTAPNQGTAHFEYSPLGWLTKVTDRNGNITLYAYNGHGDMVRITSPDSGVTEYAYDAAGRVASLTRADGTVTNYTHDALGRVTGETISWAAYNGIPGAQFHTMTYDSCAMGKGRLCAMSDSTGTASYSYLKSGELASQTSSIGGVSFGLNFAYDAHGRLSTASYPNGVILRYSYTSDHRVARIEAQIAGVWRDVINSAAYQPFGGPLIGFAHGNGWNRQLDVDLDGRVTKIYGAGTTHPQHLVYGYNANDQITGITNTKNAGATQGYGYDAMGALTSATAPATGQHNWQYDANGNRLSHTWGGGSDTYSGVPGTNRLASLSGPRPRSATYDPNGNLRNETRGGVTVERRYNGLNRQVKLIRPSAQTLALPNGATLSLPPGTWDYAYNALGQRVSKSQLGGSTSRYLFSPGSLLLGETNPGSTSLDTIYVWLEGKPVGVIRGNQLYAVHTDHLGRPEVATNAAKAIVWRATNLAFDRNVTTDTFGGLGIGFPGQQYDTESATWYNVFRDYDASVGRYTRSDPVGLKGGLNGFAYGSNNPITRVDPLGLKDYTQCETEVLLMISAEYASNGYGGVRPTAMAIVNHGFLMDFATNEPASTFNVRGTEYNAAQFGNFAAGYAGAYYNRYVGESLVMAAGITYNVAEGIVTAITGGGGSGRTIDGDAGSRPYISAGFDTGISDRDSGRPDVCGCEQ